MSKKTIVVNIFGVPGAGKSTLALGIAHALSVKGHRVELIQEFAKEKVWEEALKVLDDQTYIFAKQSRRMNRVRGKVDYIVTDSPLMLSHLYGADEPQAFLDLVTETFNSFNNVNIFLERGHKYDPVGRIQTEGESEALKPKILDIMHKLPNKYLKLRTPVQIPQVIESIYRMQGTKDIKLGNVVDQDFLKSFEPTPELVRPMVPLLGIPPMLPVPPAVPKKALIVALSGKARSGKDTFATYASRILGEHMACESLAYGDHIKNYAKGNFGWDGSKDANGRGLLDCVGLLLRSKSETNDIIPVLRNRLKAAIAPGKVIFVTDVRRIEEIYDLMRFAGINKNLVNFVAVRVNSNRKPPKKSEEITSAVAASDNECALDNFDKWDYVVSNNDTISDYANKIHNIVTSWRRMGYVKL